MISFCISVDVKQILTFKGNICKIYWISTFSHRSGLSFCLVKMQKKFSLSPFANGTQAFTLLASKQPKTQKKKNFLTILLLNRVYSPLGP